MQEHTPQLPLFTTAPGDSSLEIPYGYCKCGCGNKTKISPQSSAIHKHINGVPRDYLPGHSARRTVTITLADVFWSFCQKRNPDECWLWQGTINIGGYGVFGFRRKDYYAHRVSYELHYGTIPPTFEVCHNCPGGLDNPSCVNPHHFFLGTQADNMKDMHKKQRHAHGERMGNAKLTENDVREIRRLRAQGMLQREIAERMNVQRTTVWGILKGKSWQHVT